MKTGFSSFYKAKSDINNIRVKTHDEWNVECLHQIRLIAIRHFSVEKEGFGWLIGNGSIWMPGEINLLPFFAAKIKKKKKEKTRQFWFSCLTTTKTTTIRVANGPSHKFKKKKERKMKSYKKKIPVFLHLHLDGSRHHVCATLTSPKLQCLDFICA